ncbi:tetratricopeptide repeat protein [Streptomyces microflavus]|uniref:tetratricopeptide repeat protein n=1 Tax=Streptomyces microflavus TaxID=1919 RepID=UPI002E3277EF|nr:tetratricopeptide repeat protein [Streptomyces microflavus]
MDGPGAMGTAAAEDTEAAEGDGSLTDASGGNGREPVGTALCVVCEQYADQRSFPRLTGAVTQMEKIAEQLGDLRVATSMVGGGNPSWATFDDALTDWSEGWRETGAAKPAIIVWSGHGVLVDDELRLALSDLDLDTEQVIRDARVLKRGVPAERLINDAVASGADQILVIIDTCYAGEAVGRGLEKALRRWETMSTPPDQVKWFGIMASCRRTEPSDGSGPLLAALTEVLRDGPVTTEYRSAWSAHNELISGPDLLTALGERWRGEGQTPVPASVGTGRPVFPNPRHVPGAPARLVEHLVLAARGVGYQEEGWFFTGRRRVLGRIVAWLAADEPGLFLVTGPAGCGKSAVLGRIATLTDPVQRRETEAHGGLREDDPDPGLHPDRALASVHLRGLSPLQAASDLARQLRLPEPRNADDFRGELRELSPKPVLILDGLDEVPTEHLRAMIEELVFPLSRTNSVLLGSRDRAFRSRLAEDEREYETLPDALTRLIGTGVATADLEEEPHTQDDIGEYVFRRCAAVRVPEGRAREAGDAVAARATSVGGGFLFARLVTGSMLRVRAVEEDQWPAGLPDSIEAAFDEDLRAGAVRIRADGTELPSAARDLLTALAWAIGRGMPAGGIWESVAGALNGSDVEYDESDVDWALSTYGRYIIEDSEHGQAVYRLYHREFVSHLARREGPDGTDAGEQTLAALVSHVKARAVGSDWTGVDPYVVRGLAQHAVRAGSPGIKVLRGLVKESQTSESQFLAQALHRYSERLKAEGNFTGALASAQEALTLYKELERNYPGTFTTAVVRTLVSVANRYADIGDREAALLPAREAVMLQRNLADSAGGASLPDLALCLGTLGPRLYDTGDHEGALTLTRDAVNIYRQLAAQNPAAFRPGLAAALNNLGLNLASVGERRASVPTAQEAVKIHSELAASHPEEFLDGLASALTNLARSLKEVGSHGEALPHAERAVRVNRKRSERHPAALFDLAGSLSNLSVHREKVGDRTGCLAPAREAVEICRKLVSHRPAALQPMLAGALHNLADRISATGDHAGALAPAQEATRMYVRLASEQPGTFKPELARSLTSLSNKTNAAGDRSAAVPLARYAVRIQRELAADRPAASLPNLAGMLNNLALHLVSAGDPVAALHSAAEANGLYRHLAAEDPIAFLPEFATSLNNLGNLRATLGDTSGALASGLEAVSIRRSLVSQQPTVFRQDLATALTNLSAHLNRSGDPTAGLRAAEEAVTLHRELAEQQPAFRLHLAQSLGTLANNLADTGSLKRALALANEGIRLLRQLVDEMSSAYLPDLVLALQNFSRHLRLNEDDEGAVIAAKEALAACRTLALDNSIAFERNLISTITLLTRALIRTDDLGSAIRVFDETLEEFTFPHPLTAQRLGVERSIFLLDFPDPHASIGIRGLVTFLTEGGTNVAAVRARQALRNHDDHEMIRAVWEEETLTSAPAWLCLPPKALNTVTSWLTRPSWPASRDFWSQNAEALSDEETATALEELALLDSDTAQQYAALREAILVHGATAAYEPLILAELVAEWVNCADWAESRAFLQEHLRLLDSQPPESTPRTHVTILDVARAEGLDAAYRLVEDRAALQDYVEKALEDADGIALLRAAAIEGQVFDDQLSSLTHVLAAMVLAGTAEKIDPNDLTPLLPQAPEETRARLLQEILALSARPADPHGGAWLRIIQALSRAA